VYLPSYTGIVECWVVILIDIFGWHAEYDPGERNRRGRTTQNDPTIQWVLWALVSVEPTLRRQPQMLLEFCSLPLFALQDSGSPWVAIVPSYNLRVVLVQNVQRSEDAGLRKNLNGGTNINGRVI